jgi:hypothetical protein
MTPDGDNVCWLGQQAWWGAQGTWDKTFHKALAQRGNKEGLTSDLQSARLTLFMKDNSGTKMQYNYTLH